MYLPYVTFIHEPVAPCDEMYVTVAPFGIVVKTVADVDVDERKLTFASALKAEVVEAVVAVFATVDLSVK